MITRDMINESLYTDEEVWQMIVDAAPLDFSEEGKISLYIHIAPDKRVYVGVTTNTYLRWKDKGAKYNRSRFRNALDEFGWDNFEHHVILDKLTEEQADVLEQLFIAYYKATDLNYGFNKCTGGTRREQYRNRKVICLDTKKIYDSAYIAEKKTGKLSTLIILNCNGNIDYVEDGEQKLSRWMFYDDYLNKK